jgi:hypothetical protein
MLEMRNEKDGSVGGDGGIDDLVITSKLNVTCTIVAT